MRYIKSILSVGIIIFILFAIAIVVDGLNDNIKKSDVLVILGNKVEVTGMPSATLQSRLEKGFELYTQGIAGFIIVSGGIGKEGFDEAQVMKQYLVSKGMPSEAIIEDNKGIDTFSTAQNTRAILKEKN